MDFRPLPPRISGSDSSLLLEAYSLETAQELWAAILLDRMHPKRRGIWPSCAILEDVEAYVRSCRHDHPDTEDYGYLIRSSSGQLLGTFHIHSVDWEKGIAELGYWIHHSFTGQGFATIALGAVENFLFQFGFRLLEIQCPVWNVKSQAVAARAGYRFRHQAHAGKICTGCDECLRVYEKASPLTSVSI